MYTDHNNQDCLQPDPHTPPLLKLTSFYFPEPFARQSELSYSLGQTCQLVVVSSVSDLNILELISLQTLPREAKFKVNSEPYQLFKLKESCRVCEGTCKFCEDVARRSG